MSSLQHLLSSVLTVALAFVVADAANAQSQKLDRVVREVVQKHDDSGARHGVIVRAQPGQRPWLRTQLVNQGLEIQSDHPLIEGMALDLAAAEIERFCSNVVVEHCSSNPVVTATAVPGKAGAAGGLNIGGALAIVAALDCSVADTNEPWAPALLLCPGVQQSAAAAIPACSTSIGGQHHVRARNIVWGNSIVWGNTVYYNLPTWNQLKIQGSDATLLGPNIVWGDNIVWADGTGWAATSFNLSTTSSGATTLSGASLSTTTSSGAKLGQHRVGGQVVVFDNTLSGGTRR
jgi:hypothetical protein